MAFHALEQLHRLQDGYKQAFKIDGVSLLLVQEEGKTFIIENRCPHMDVPLERGALVPEKKIRCLAHGIVFDLQSGKAEGPLANTLDCLKRFPVAYEGNKVGVDL